MKPALALYLALALPAAAAAQQGLAENRAGGALLAVGYGERYKIIEKYNFRKKTGKTYLGSAYRELRGVLRREAPGKYAGDFFVLEETKRENKLVAQRIDASYPASFTVLADGSINAPAGSRFPVMRAFPAFPGRPLLPGANWQAPAERVLDPDWSGTVTRARVYVDYRYQGPTVYKGFPGHRVTAKYALRYKAGLDRSGDPKLKSASGTHDLSLFIPAEAGGPRLISETFKELYSFEDGRETQLEGTILTVYEGVTALDRPGTIEDLTKTLNRLAVKTEPEPAKPGRPESSSPAAPAPAAALPLGPGDPAGLAGIPDIEVGSRPEGVSLTVNKLRFKADSAELLAEEAGRLDAVYQALAAVPRRSIMVVGHAASVGNPAGEQRLSAERAGAVAAELMRRGIKPERLTFRGKGSSEPVAPNDGEAGRARNRRVEIIILED